MRRALGLRSDGPSQPTADHTSSPTLSLHPQRRRFVRDGEVVVQHREHVPHGDTGTNQLDAARQALREQMAAREEVERALVEVQTANQNLQTKLAHERLARDEALGRAEADRQALQAVQAELATERELRQQVEGQLERALIMPTARGKPGRKPGRPAAAARPVPEAVPALIVALTDTDNTQPLPRRRGRPPKVREPETDQQADAAFVEWWVPGWKSRIR